jgi:hypothetical protein
MAAAGWCGTSLGTTAREVCCLVASSWVAVVWRDGFVWRIVVLRNYVDVPIQPVLFESSSR